MLKLPIVVVSNVFMSLIFYCYVACSWGCCVVAHVRPPWCKCIIAKLLVACCVFLLVCVGVG